MMRTNPKSWCRTFQKIGSFCEDVDNNPVESFNGSLNKARGSFCLYVRDYQKIGYGEDCQAVCGFPYSHG